MSAEEDRPGIPDFQGECVGVLRLDLEVLGGGERVGAVRIGANECWTGPFPVAAEAAFKLVTEGNRYEPDNEHEKLFAAVAQVDGADVTLFVDRGVRERCGCVPARRRCRAGRRYRRWSAAGRGCGR